MGVPVRETGELASSGAPLADFCDALRAPRFAAAPLAALRSAPLISPGWARLACDCAWACACACAWAWAWACAACACAYAARVSRLDTGPLHSAEEVLTFFCLARSGRIVFTRFRLLMTSVFSEMGRGRPCSLRKRPQALQRQAPVSSRRHSGVVDVPQFWQVGFGVSRS